MSGAAIGDDKQEGYAFALDSFACCLPDVLVLASGRKFLPWTGLKPLVVGDGVPAPGVRSVLQVLEV